jgi:hypothetical protein
VINIGNAKDYGDVIKILVNDTTLKELMIIPTLEQTNYGLLVNKYFLQTYISEKFTEDGVCRLLVRSAMQSETNNEYIKWNGVLIEIYVPKSKDLMSGFETRINQISDRLQYLFNRQYINYNKLCFESCFELASISIYYKRYVCRFNYKKIYR